MTGFTEADICAGALSQPKWQALLAGLTDTQLCGASSAVAKGSPAFAEAIEQEVKWLKMEQAARLAGGDAGRAVDRCGYQRHSPRDAGFSPY